MKELSGVQTNKPSIVLTQTTYLLTYYLLRFVYERRATLDHHSCWERKIKHQRSTYLPTYLPTLLIRADGRVPLPHSLARSLTHSPIHPTGYSFTTATLCRLG
jgi:hypothetical protein